VKGLDAIRDKVSALNFGGARVDLTDGSVDAQRSDGDGVLVMVTGDFSKPGHESRRFVQSFFLASQTIGPNVSFMYTRWINRSRYVWLLTAMV
jgi:Nuclear transport factor 2 (NTF2) domain